MKQPTKQLKELKRGIATAIFEAWKPFTGIAQSFHDEVVRLYAEKTPDSIRRGNELNGELCKLKDKCSDAADMAYDLEIKRLSRKDNTRNLRNFSMDLLHHLNSRYETLLHF
jgi:hypothetical protein